MDNAVGWNNTNGNIKETEYYTEKGRFQPATE